VSNGASCSIEATRPPLLSATHTAQVVFGCGNDKFGGCGSILSIHEQGCGGCSALAGAGGRESTLRPVCVPPLPPCHPSVAQIARAPAQRCVTSPALIPRACAQTAFHTRSSQLTITSKHSRSCRKRPICRAMRVASTSRSSSRGWGSSSTNILLAFLVGRASLLSRPSRCCRRSMCAATHQVSSEQQGAFSCGHSCAARCLTQRAGLITRLQSVGALLYQPVAHSMLAAPKPHRQVRAPSWEQQDLGSAG